MPFLAPIGAAFAAFASTFVGQLVIGVAISVGTSLLKQLFAPKPEEPRRPGMNLSVTVGDDNPLSIMIGHSATGGTRRYINSWGTSGDVPNAYLTEVIQLDDLPGIELGDVWLQREKVTVLWGATPTAQGYPIQQYRVNGKDHAWIKFRDGSETTADSFLVSRFGSDPNYPWTSDMIGRGSPHVIVTTLLDKDRELWKNQQPSWLFEVQPRKFYDWRKDSTNGGSGAHRWNDQSTWEPTTNPVVVIYNIIRGIYWNGEWYYGGRNLPAFRLPVSNWTAAANECDRAIPLQGGGSEPQFRCGTQLQLDIEPLTAIEDLARSCLTRICETGGIFEILVGAPGESVFHFTDNDIIVSRSQGYTSFPSLNDSQNGIEAVYPEPGEMWVAKDAPARYNADWEAEDGERRLATGLEFGAVPYGLQVQRLMETLIRENRRWRTHVIGLPPAAWVLTGTSVVSWTSERNGYVNKKFLVQTITGETSKIQLAVIIEIEPGDYDWSPSEELPNPIGNLVVVRPAPQPVVGFTAVPTILNDSQGRPRRPGIIVTYPGEMPDISAVRVLVQLTATGAYVFDGTVPYEEPYSNVLTGSWCLGGETYDVTIQYIAESNRLTLPSVPITVTMFNVDIELPDLGQYLQSVIGLVDSTDPGSIQSQLASLIQKSEDLALALLNVNANLRERLDLLVVQHEGAVAAVIRNEVAIVEERFARAEAITQVLAQVDEVIADGFLRFEAEVDENASTALIAAKVRAASGLDISEAAWTIQAEADGQGGTASIFGVYADSFYVIGPSSQSAMFQIVDDQVRMENALIRDLTALNIDVENLFAQNVNITGTLRVGPGSTGPAVLIQGGNNRILITDNT